MHMKNPVQKGGIYFLNETSACALRYNYYTSPGIHPLRYNYHAYLKEFACRISSASFLFCFRKIKNGTCGINKFANKTIQDHTVDMKCEQFCLH
jgi:hypothetical protein